MQMRKESPPKIQAWMQRSNEANCELVVKLVMQELSKFNFYRLPSIEQIFKTNIAESPARLLPRCMIFDIELPVRRKLPC